MLPPSLTQELAVLPGGGVETAELLARSQRLEVLLEHTSSSLKSLEERLNASESIASFGHFKVDEFERFQLSASARALLGIEAANASLDEALAHAPSADCDRFGAALWQLIESGQQVDLEVALELPQSGTRWVRLAVRRTQSARSSELYGLIIDVTEARREAVRRDIALKVSEALLRDIESQTAYESALQTVCAGLGWDMGSCWLMDARGQHLRCLAIHAPAGAGLEELADSTRGRSLASGQGMVGAVHAAREACWSDDVAAEVRFAERALAERCGIRSAYTFPILVDTGTCIGVVQFLSRNPRRADALLPSLSQLIGTLLAQRVRRESWITRLRQVAERDALTGLYSRYALMERIWRLSGSADARPFAVISFDLNRFRLINEALGHEAGDLVLKALAARAQVQLPPGVRLARLSGDEFAALVPGEGVAVERVVAGIEACAAEPVQVNGYEFSLTAAVGVARFPSDGSEAEALLRDADARRRRSKRSSRSAPALPRTASAASALTEIQLEQELRNAIDSNTLEVHYQPIVRLSDSQLAGAEALIRWRHPTRGLLTPAGFLPLADAAGLSRAISRVVLGCVTRDLGAAAALLPPGLRVNVNLSALDFRDLKLFKEIGELLRVSGVAAERLRFEITESMLMEDVGMAERVVGLLADYGVEFAIDDFGTGYSSLGQLARLPVHEIKIDQSFTAAMGSGRGKAVVRAVLDLASRLGMPVTAEGVESREQSSTLAAYGCEKGQGYLFGRPAPFRDLLRLVTAGNARPVEQV
ncbi:MAG: bifunctional diguanylate cyclase/phosphodiesterase [Burkholderiales bacterium]|nr:bifunctional diguanylate cyclase/phosphodiesterase [Burkholderiales bacterium]